MINKIIIAIPFFVMFLIMAMLGYKGENNE